MMKLDETNKTIIRELKDDGRKPFSQIAQEIGVTENTVRARVNQMIRENILSISALVDPQTIPEMQVVIMGIKLKTMDLEKKAKEFMNLKGVISAVVVTGRFDLIVHLVTSSDEDKNLLNFFKFELSKISEVSDVETFVVYQAHNFKVPYLL